MNCGKSDELWRDDSDHRDARLAAHIATCASCRAAAAEVAAIQAALKAWPDADVPEAVRAQYAGHVHLADAPALTCAEVRTMLEEWRAGELDAARAFLVADHMLECAECEAELARAEAVSDTLVAWPGVAAPADVQSALARDAGMVSLPDLGCSTVRAELEAWREGDLTPVRAFQLEDHLLKCAACAQEAERAEDVSDALTTWLELPAPASVGAGVAENRNWARVPSLTCGAALDDLEAWRAGELSPVRAFLMDEHLMACERCAAEVERAEALTSMLVAWPEVAVPAAVAERVAAGRIPWWERIAMPAFAPRLGWGMAAAAAIGLATFIPRLWPVAVVVARAPEKPAVVAPAAPENTTPERAPLVAVLPSAVSPAPVAPPVVAAVRPATRPAAPAIRQPNVVRPHGDSPRRRPEAAPPRVPSRPVPAPPAVAPPVRPPVAPPSAPAPAPAPVVLVKDSPEVALTLTTLEADFAAAEATAERGAYSVAMLPGAETVATI